MILSSFLLNSSTVLLFTTSAGRLFQVSQILYVTMLPPKVVLYLFSSNFKPLFQVWLLLKVNSLLTLIFVIPLTILKVSGNCPLNRLVSRLYKFRRFSLLSYPSCLIDGISLVALAYTASSLLISLWSDGDQNCTAYSRWGRTNEV